MFRHIPCSTILRSGLLALAAGACGDSTGDSNSPVHLSLQPQFPASYAEGVFDLAVDRVRVRLIRPPAEAVVDTVVVFPANANELSIKVKVPLIARREVLTAGVELRAGTRILFAGTRELEVSDVPGVAPTIPLQYVGPGTTMTSLRIEPRDSALRPGEAFQYRVLAFSGQAEIQDFYVGWSTSDPEHVTVDATGSLVVPGERGSFFLRVVSPTGVKDSTRVWISLPPTGMTYIAGNEQTSFVGSQLQAPLVVRVVTLDGSGVPGVPVRYSALSGGAVRDPVVLTDAEGYARNHVILGPIAGLQIFEARAAGLPTVTFRANASAGPPFRISALAGAGQQDTVGHVLPNALIARVTDAAGNFIPGVPLTWQVVVGGGVLEQVDTQTNLNGVALGIYRLGPVPGTNVVRVTASGLVLFADFGATAVVGSPAFLDKVAGDGQTGLPGASLAPFTVLVTDEFGNVLPGVAVHWTVLDGAGTLSAATTSTNINGRASVSYQLPLLPGTVHIQAQAGTTAVTTVFTATVAEPPPETSTRSPLPDQRRADSGGFRRAD